MDWHSYDSIASDYARISQHAYFDQPARDLISLLDPPTNGRLCDLGCGTGAVLQAATAFMAREALITGIDLSVPMLTEARRTMRAALVAGRLPHLPFAGESLDSVTLGFVIQHLANPAPLLAEISRVLRVRGRIGMTCWADSASDNDAGRVWSEVSRKYVDLEEIQRALDEALPGTNAYRELETFASVPEVAGFEIVAAETRTYPIVIDTGLWIASRALSTGPRFVRSRLTEPVWHDLVDEVAARLNSDFGQTLPIETQVNFVVAAKSD